MEHPICVTCGTQFAAEDGEPDSCPICEDERQYVRWEGQAWTTLRELRGEHDIVLEELEPGLVNVDVEPRFAIGQRALLVRTPRGNVLWDCLPYLDEAAVEAIEARGGLSAIAISHPHFYGAMVEWSRAFGDVPVHLHAADRDWVMRPDPVIEFWEGETFELPGGATLIRTGGHFDGSTVLHWPEGADGRGALLTGDSITVARDRRFVTFMYSYPNQVPLSPASVEEIVESVTSLPFDRIYGGRPGGYGDVVPSGARDALLRSAERYVNAVTD